MNLKTNILAAVAGLGVLAFANTVRADHEATYVGSLIYQLQNAYDEDDREDAAEDLGKLGDPAALPALQSAALYDRDDDVREEAREAIERINRPRVIYQAAPVVYQDVHYVEPAPVIIHPAPVVYRTHVIHRAHHSHRPLVVHRSHRSHFGHGFHGGHGRSIHVSHRRHH
jgi:hypothetical protein